MRPDARYFPRAISSSIARRSGKKSVRWTDQLYSEAERDEYTTNTSGPNLQDASASTDRPSRAPGNPLQITLGKSASTCQRSDHAALRIGGSFTVRRMRTVAASQHASPQIRNISAVASALKPVRRPSMKSSDPTLKNQLFKSHAENMTAPPNKGDGPTDGSLRLEHGSHSDFILHPGCERNQGTEPCLSFNPSTSQVTFFQHGRYLAVRVPAKSESF